MKKLLIFFTVLSTFVFSAIDEYKTDVYFANGILAEKKDARDNAGILRDAIIEKIGINYYNKHIGKVDYAYNTTLGKSKDMYEAYLQLNREDPDFFRKLDSFLGRFFSGQAIDDINQEIADAKVYEQLIQEVHDADLTLQVNKYRQSINSGHSVVVIAHSQGALFTNEAYEKLTKVENDNWRKDFFKAFFVAPASTMVLMKDKKQPAFVFSNDPISRLASHFGFQTIDNPNLYEEKSKDQWGDVAYYNKNNDIFHAFKYYMGNTITYTDGRGTKSVSTDIAKDKIVDFIENSVKSHNIYDSQWKIKKEKGCSCKEKYVEMTHIKDSSSMDKLLEGQVKNFTSADGGKGKIYPVDSKYVLASAGGVSIEEIQNSEICLTLKDENQIQIGNIRGRENDNSTTSFTPGVLTVDMLWEDSSIDMQLEVGGLPGELQIAEGCPPAQHYFVKTEDNIKPGVYPVYVRHSGIVDESDMPENIFITIDVPGNKEAMVFDLNITHSNMLNIGQVAEIEIEEDGEVIFVPKISTNTGQTTVTHYSSSGGSGSGGSGNTVEYSKFEYKVKSKLKQALLGPLSNATIHIRDIKPFTPAVQSPLLALLSASNDLVLLRVIVSFFCLIFLSCCV